MDTVTTKTSSQQPKLKVDWRELRKQKQQSKHEKELKRVRKAEEEEEKCHEKEKRKKEEKILGIHQTVSIAVPASIVNNAQSAELKTYLIGQVARACVIFNCDEIIVYDEYSTLENVDIEILRKDHRTRCIAQMVRVLQYLECPQYLRKYLFPIHEDLQYAGLLNPIDSPHHLKEYDKFQFREGVVTDRISPDNDGSYVNIGLRKEILIPQSLSPGLRVTVELDLEAKNKKKMRGIPVSPSDPRKRTGRYWGYSVRVASTFSSVFSECPYSSYDLTIGTSERGESVDAALLKIPSNYEHALIVFGGLKGIEAAIDADETYLNIQDSSKIFNYYINTCPNQGSNTIRTEEAILITLSALRSKLPISACTPLRAFT
ncbi:28S rRNA (uridine-N(3))-methyltransferase [Brevipalpus obovatus]|uniref:28S rRNA (uridine-N(3))-methyltransferase n=1 Tax=Brevipalpus obovatus TaxID=246614 RepID=UPI003D9F83BC